MHGMPKICLVITTILSLSGCVTESTYQGTDVKISERKLDKLSASRERMQLGLTYLNRGNPEQAKYNLDKAMEYAPEHSDVHVAMAYYYQTVGDLIRTEESYNRAIDAQDATGDAKNNFGVFLCQQKKYARSEEMFLAAIETLKYTRTASSYENLGLCSRAAGELKKARQYFEIALKYDPKREVSLLELAELAVQDSNYALAQEQLALYHRVINQSSQSLALGIKIEQALSDYDAAKQFGIILLAKFPASTQAQEYRANLQ
jgi:type IV pilus assembly protein PilF